METSVSFFCIACFFLLSYALGSALGRPRRLGIPPPRGVRCFQWPNFRTSFFNLGDILLNNDDINPKSSTVIHIFSNVIDLDDFDGDSVLSLLNEDKSRNNIIVCVSPYYQEATRGKRMKEFGDKLQGHTLVYKLEKHTDDWDKPYSCQIYIFVSSYY